MKLLYVLFVIFLVIFSAITIATVEEVDFIEEGKEIINDIVVEIEKTEDMIVRAFLSDIPEEEQEEIITKIEEARLTLDPAEEMFLKVQEVAEKNDIEEIL